MKRFNEFDDIRLAERVRSLERDVEDFEARALREAAALEAAGRSPIGSPLHQRLTSILKFMRDELKGAEAEVERRAAEAAVQRRRPLKGAVLEALRSLWPIRQHAARRSTAFMFPVRPRDTRNNVPANRSSSSATPIRGTSSRSIRSSYDPT